MNLEPIKFWSSNEAERTWKSCIFYMSEWAMLIQWQRSRFSILQLGTQLLQLKLARFLDDSHWFIKYLLQIVDGGNWRCAGWQINYIIAMQSVWTQVIVVAFVYKEMYCLLKPRICCRMPGNIGNQPQETLLGSNNTWWGIFINSANFESYNS